MIRFCSQIPSQIEDKEMRQLKIKHDLRYIMLEAVKCRILSIPCIKYNDPNKSIAVMFSGGLDSTILVSLIAETLKSQEVFDSK